VFDAGVAEAARGSDVAAVKVATGAQDLARASAAIHVERFDQEAELLVLMLAAT
jgi:hypothetical protein